MFNTLSHGLVWVTCRGNWNGWWRALVSVKLKCVTRSDYVVLMLGVYPRLTAQAFSRVGNKEMQQLFSLWLSIGVGSSVRTGLCPVQDVLLSDLLLWLVEWELKVWDQQALLPLFSPKSWMSRVKFLNLKLYKWLDFKTLPKSTGSEARVECLVCNC